ncbi:hypothetical protein RsTz2092_13150 [Deferribacterales bacterium RsTz2092]|nr:hypothetical protein AGMMS49941_10400 [Deferribacterales bacterium]GHU87206.1 hypothetical protein AGMMS49941_10450 [Deferribacterales bacterium]
MIILDVVLGNIRAELKRQGITQNEFAEQMGYSNVYMSDMLRKIKLGADSLSFLEKAAGVLGISPHQLITANVAPVDSYVSIPYLGGDVPDVAFNVDFINRLGVATDALFVNTMPDESMEPTIKAGDLLLIAKRREIKHARIYMFKLGGDTIIKRIILQTDYNVFVKADNSSFPSSCVDKAELTRSLVGELVWQGRRA